MIKFPIEALLSKIREFITDPRSNHGKRYPLETILSIAVCAVLCGCKGYRAIGAWSGSLSSEELIRFGSNRKSPPSEPTIRRVIQRVDAGEFDQQIGQWLLEQKLCGGSDHLSGRALAIDGKTLRGSHDGARKKPIHLLSAVIHKEGVVVAQDEVGEKTNEIKHVNPLLKSLDIEGYVVTADALHTQKEVANYLVEEKKADFIFTAKGNQPTLLEDIKFVDLKKTAKPNRMQSPTTKDMGG